jgi:hypothetical protein
MITRFKELCEDDTLKFRSIMKTMNAEFGTSLSRNACIGKARRLKMPPRAKDNNPVKLHPEGLPLDKLRERTCRWPMGPTMQRPPYFFCGKPTAVGCPYCKTHKQRSHTHSTYSAKIYDPA